MQMQHVVIETTAVAFRVKVVVEREGWRPLQFSGRFSTKAEARTAALNFLTLYRVRVVGLPKWNGEGTQAVCFAATADLHRIEESPRAATVYINLGEVVG